MSGRDDDERAGYSLGDPRDDGAEFLREAPADLVAVQADDALLDLLGGGGPMPSDIDGELASVLVAWRRDVDAESIKDLVDTDTAVAVIAAARRPTRRRNPLLGPIAAAAAVLVIAFSGVGLVAKSARPGDNLWGLTEVLYTDYARSVEAAALVRTELDEANTALRAGKTMEARTYLKRAQQQLPVIAEAEGRTDLTARHNQLEKMLAGADEGQAQGTDSPPLSIVPVPPTSSTTTPTTTSTSKAEPAVDESASPGPRPSLSSSPEPLEPPKPSSSPEPPKPPKSPEPSGSPRSVPNHPNMPPMPSGTSTPHVPHPRG